ncbi:unnamed protein product [Callosobruchus maculatus]|uniref:DDE Tnp4 domain-containing protein n=1 Tax=Callosobruchus maculatus TaxID=64391 RepID=A0A653D287_CALMS|nr:unnamed protein product [Callosobruchus maculatus]
MAIGDIIGVRKSSASKIVKKVSLALAKLSPRFIKMPQTEEEILKEKQAFYERARLPRIIGSIDCTHVKIQSPGGARAEMFRNRKGYFSINVQTVASTSLKIMDIVARWPGSAHDQTVFDNSAIKRRLHNREFGESVLIADSGYANTLHVITPLIQPANDIQNVFNEAVTRTRNPVERQYGVWKRRFPILAVGIRVKLATALNIIVATAVLHNIAIEENEDEPVDDPEMNVNVNEECMVEATIGPNYVNARDFLLSEYIPQLLH